MKTKLTILFFLISINCFSQFSKTHYIPPLSNSEDYNTLDQVLLISCPNTNSVNYKIIEIGGTVTTGSVSRDNPSEIFIGNGSNTQLLANGPIISGVMNNKGYIIEADDLIYVTVRVAVTNHAGGLVSKGLAALGNEFRIGGFLNNGVGTDGRHHTFASVLATENNTVVNFSNVKPGTVLYNNSNGSTPFSVTLNSGESFIIATNGNTNPVPDGLIGALITSSKPIAVNCGSYGGTNGTDSLRSDIGFDQIVGASRIGNEYIFIKGSGTDIIERPLIIAHENNTEIYVNGNTLPTATINAGDYYDFNGSSFSPQGNLYVRTSKNVFAYQGIGGVPDEANQNMHFLPPLSCQTPKAINNIPKINSIASNSGFNGSVCIVTKTGASLNFIINGANYTLSSLPPGVTINGPFNVIGNPDYQTYTFRGLSGNISVFSSESVYLSYYGTSNAATYGGFYSGFTFKPEISFNKINLVSDNCIPNVTLNVNSISSFDTFEWSFNSAAIIGATSNTYTPSQPGLYKVKASISTCPSIAPLISDEIPVSSCPTNLDNDLANDNIDIDNDNDGILNCTESFGDQNINTTVNNGTINNSSVTYTATVNATTLSSNSFSGNSNGSIITETPAGKTENVIYEINFNSPISLGLDYPLAANNTDLLNANAEYIISTDINKTITVLNPTNQLLIDTNYDGIFESGVTKFSSFEIRFRLNGNTPLPAGTGTFKFLSYKTTSLSIKHKNLLDSQNNRSTFRIYASCVEKDSDGDGISDQLDTDSDNDGILDTIEAQGNSAVLISNADTNLDGLDNAFEPGFVPFDNDGDSIPDYLDLDSDNDGIRDIVETGNDLDNDSIKNYRDLDSDADACYDVKEAGFSDPDINGIFGISPITLDADGLVVGAPYSVPNNNYKTSAPIVVNNQPVDSTQCLYESTTFGITSNADVFQWQLSTDKGITWSPLLNDATYNNVTTNTLTINNIQNNMNNYLYRVQLNRNGNSCDFYSTSAKLNVYPKPILNSGVRIVQCDDNTDGITVFNLKQKESFIISNPTSYTFTYFLSTNGAQSNDVNDLISNPVAYPNNVPYSQTIWVRVTDNITNCFEVTSILLISSTTNAILQNSNIPELHQCDDYLDAANDDYDGISSFDLSSVQTYIDNLITSTGYTYNFYKNYNDFLQESDANGNSLAITNIQDYRNVGYPNLQTIWVRLEDSNTNDCLGSTSFNLVVEPKPNIDVNLDGADNTHICTDDATVYQTLTSGLPSTENPNDYTYVWTRDGAALAETTPTISVNTAGNYEVTVSYITGLQCSRSREILVEESNTAQIVGTPIIKDLVDNNSISVTVSGDGNYVFALDDQFGPTQTSGYFENITPGIHTVYVIDLYGCSVLKIPFSIVGFPEFFTPNGDGYHDNWNIIGANTSFNSDTKILIYNRYGKLIKEILPLGNGWDGNYLGKPQPADDYWFTAILKDGRNVKGHFALKR